MYIENCIPEVLMNRLRTMDDGRMARIVELRLGLIDGRKHSLQEIGRSFGGLTRERIRQIERDAIKHLKQLATEEEKNIDSIIDALRLSARENSKKKHKLKPSKNYRPTVQQLNTLRQLVDTGLDDLHSVGIFL